MREEVKKYLFVGVAEDQKEFFEEAQQAGIIHFINPRQKAFKDFPEEVTAVTRAIKILRGLPTSEQEENFSLLDGKLIVNQILDLQGRRNGLEDQITQLNLEIDRIHMFGDFSLEDKSFIEKETHQTIQFFSAKPSLYQDAPLPAGLIYVESDHGMDYYVAINDHPVTYDKMIEIKIEHSLSSLSQQLANAQVEREEVEQTLKKLTPYKEFLHHYLMEKLNHYHLDDTQTYVQQVMDDSIFAIEGWVPVNKLEQLRQLGQTQAIFMEEIAIEPEDVKPTFLENHGFSRLGEDLVHVYDTPSATDKDPSKWVLFSFLLFFAFIIGDAGYGLVYLTIALILRYKFPDVKGAGKRFIDLFTLVSIACVCWGVIMTSFFGMSIGIDNPIRKLSVVEWLAEKRVSYDITHEDEAYQEWIKKHPELAKVKDPKEFLRFIPSKSPEKGPVVMQKAFDNTLFELALFIGVVHLVLSLLRYGLRTWSHFGWAIFLVGGYLYFSASLNLPSFAETVFGISIETAEYVGFELLMIGLGTACLLSIIQNGWLGIFEIMTVVQLFADSLSYLRLYALALAGAIVAATVNEMASGLPFILGALLIVISHAINIALATMSGLIHGLRLNYLEWYRWSFEGGGKEFRPLKLLKKE